MRKIIKMYIVKCLVKVEKSYISFNLKKNRSWWKAEIIEIFISFKLKSENMKKIGRKSQNNKKYISMNLKKNSQN